jgi:hypothetical protein
MDGCQDEAGCSVRPVAVYKLFSGDMIEAQTRRYTLSVSQSLVTSIPTKKESAICLH